MLLKGHVTLEVGYLILRHHLSNLVLVGTVVVEI